MSLEHMLPSFFSCTSFIYICLGISFIGCTLGLYPCFVLLFIKVECVFWGGSLVLVGLGVVRARPRELHVAEFTPFYPLLNTTKRRFESDMSSGCEYKFTILFACRCPNPLITICTRCVQHRNEQKDPVVREAVRKCAIDEQELVT